MANPHIRILRAFDPGALTMPASVSGSLRVDKPGANVEADVRGNYEELQLKDFPICATLLNVSSVWAPMVDDKDGVLHSDDNVIPLHDKIDEIETLVAWLTRSEEFCFTKENMQFLARLADKYDIKALHRDIQMFIASLLYRRSLEPSMPWWIFAVRYEFHELEKFCLNSDEVKHEILSKLRAPQSGIGYFLNDVQLPIFAVNTLINAILFSGEWTRVVRSTMNKEEEERRAPISFTFGKHSR